MAGAGEDVEVASSLTGGEVDAWQLQDAAVEQLPSALSQAFQHVQEAFLATSKVQLRALEPPAF